MPEIERIDDFYNPAMGLTGSLFYAISDSSVDGEYECWRWYEKELNLEPALESADLSCPCFFWQGLWDGRYWVDWRNIDWYSRIWCLQHVEPAQNGWGAKCCYELWWWFGSVLEGPPYGGNAYRSLRPRFYNREQEQKHKENDLDPYQYCCVASSNCHLYYERRPSVNCERYEPVLIRWFWGDPHFITLDGKNFTFNGVGEFVLLQLIYNDTDEFFTLQARTKIVPGNTAKATSFSAAVAKESNSSAVEVQAKPDGGLLVLIAGTTYSGFDDLTNQSVSLADHRLEVSRPDSKSFRASFTSGVNVKVTEGNGMLTIVFSGQRKSSWTTKGLYGTWNDDITDDLTLPNGTVLDPNLSGRALHFDYGMKWQITQAKSLFTYKENENTTTFSNPEFEPMFADSINWTSSELREKAEKQCGHNAECLFDIASSGDVSFGEATKSTAETLEKDKKENENNPPKFKGAPSVVNATVNEAVNILLVGEDKDGDNVTFSMVNSPPGAVIIVNKTAVRFKWTPTSSDNATINVVITDSLGSSSTFYPTIRLCACKNNGSCVDKLGDQGEGDSVEKFRLRLCSCTEGLTGKLCETDLDACEENYQPCYPGVKCIDQPAPANRSGYECGPCPSGLQGDGKLCDDIDECKNKANNSCKQVCLNTPGSYKCDCLDGYSLAQDKISCEDIDECKTGGVCMHKCTNTNGGYTCSCNQYFKLSSDNKTCIPSQSCSDKGGCSQVCFMADGHKKCSCNNGYELAQDGKTCHDVDECKKGTDLCTHRCTNTDGSYTCSCPSKGFRLAANKYTCEDIDECMELSYNCSESLDCVNTLGSYECDCVGDDIYLINGTCRALDKGETKPPPTPPAPPKEASKEEREAAVHLTAKEMMKSEWTAKVDSSFKEAVAEAATEYCRTRNEECGLTSRATARRKRRAVFIVVFTKYDVHLLPGYPEQRDADLLLAVYVNIPSGVETQRAAIEKDILKTILDHSMDDISSMIGKKLVFTPPEPEPKKEEGISGALIAVIVVSCVAVLLIVICTICICKRKKFKTNKVEIAMEERKACINEAADVET